MSEPGSVLSHLFEGRSALVQEVEKLTAAIAELDSVINRVGAVIGNGDSNGNGASATAPGTAPATIATQQVDSRPEVEPAASEPVMARSRKARATTTAPRKAPAKRSGRTSSRSASASGESPKSIRVHVLEMLASEERDFGLPEIIDRIHDEGIQAHDDAVRSITIKLMKDGRVERVGRGQYRLARRRSSSSVTATAPTSAPPAAPAQTPDPEPEAVEPPAPAPADVPAPVNYTPPLNLGQPWDRRV